MKRQTHRERDDKQLAEWVEKFGSSSSIVLLDPKCSIFSIPEVEGAIAYRESFQIAVAYGDPICAPEMTPALATAFFNDCHRRGKKSVYMVVSCEFADWAKKKLYPISIGFAEEMFLDPTSYIQSGESGRNLRKKVRHAERNGVAIKEYLLEDPELENAIKTFSSQWKRERRGVQLYFAEADPFRERAGKRWFYALAENRVVGVLELYRLNRFNGWVLHLLMTRNSSPIGTSEYLVLSAINALKSERESYLTFGPAVVDSFQPSKIEGCSPFMKALLQKMFLHSNKMINLKGRRDFWMKFRPESSASYYLFESFNIRTLLALHNAMNISLRFF